MMSYTKFSYRRVRCSLASWCALVVINRLRSIVHSSNVIRNCNLLTQPLLTTMLRKLNGNNNKLERTYLSKLVSPTTNSHTD
ncbi:hypothetical protein BDV95DRAFT_565519 [Massariosphaeria phaeospora]|uniref:Uncharacterized protein n=1 Tax=Massariosphaeria phaeospora TaxID=100035 RepID=A0A7C8I9N4_9PLEO|nr:hypothetical protein BDV95DRAFT_565519 [Massariosphaeria phaeospora]